MTYTLAMAADQGIQIADDGTAEVSMTGARANLTKLIRTVREDGRAGAFTERGERRVYLVPPGIYERALMDRAVVEQLMERAKDPGPDAKPDAKAAARALRDALAAVVPSPY